MEKEESLLSPETKAIIPTENSKKESDNSKAPPTNSITRWLPTDFGRSVWVQTATQLLWLKASLRDPNFPTNLGSCIIKLI